jgi:hypothetical protein
LRIKRGTPLRAHHRHSMGLSDTCLKGSYSLPFPPGGWSVLYHFYIKKTTL